MSHQTYPFEKEPQNVEIRFKKNYERIKVIGSGSFGTVFLIKNRSTNELYAAKKISKKNDKILSYREINIMTSIKSQYLVPALHIYTFYSSYYIVMDYMVASYMQLVNKNMYFNDEDAVASLFSIGSACQYLHAQNITHRDIKPDNILIDASGATKLSDFGLSKWIKSDETAEHTVCGTPWYQAPETFSAEYGHKIDLWSLGICIGVMMGCVNIKKLRKGCNGKNDDELVEYVLKKGNEIINFIKNNEITFPLINRLIGKLLHQKKRVRYDAAQLLSSIGKLNIKIGPNKAILNYIKEQTRMDKNINKNVNKNMNKNIHKNDNNNNKNIPKSTKKETFIESDKKELELEYKEIENNNKNNKKMKRKVKKKLNFETKCVSSKRFARGKTVLITMGNTQIRGWIIDINDKEILIKYEGHSHKFIQKWYKKENTKIQLFDRRNQYQ